jgi:hypothetical protein
VLVFQGIIKLPHERGFPDLTGADQDGDLTVFFLFFKFRIDEAVFDHGGLFLLFWNDTPE